MSEISHYGVPGMKWGVRKERERKPRKKKLSQREVAKRKVLVGVTGIAATAVVSGSIGYVLVKRQSDVDSKTVEAGYKAVNDYLERKRKIDDAATVLESKKAELAFESAKKALKDLETKTLKDRKMQLTEEMIRLQIQKQLDDMHKK